MHLEAEKEAFRSLEGLLRQLKELRSWKWHKSAEYRYVKREAHFQWKAYQMLLNPALSPRLTAGPAMAYQRLIDDSVVPLTAVYHYFHSVHKQLGHGRMKIDKLPTAVVVTIHNTPHRLEVEAIGSGCFCVCANDVTVEGEVYADGLLTVVQWATAHWLAQILGQQSKQAFQREWDEQSELLVRAISEQLNPVKAEFDAIDNAALNGTHSRDGKRMNELRSQMRVLIAARIQARHYHSDPIDLTPPAEWVTP